MRRRSEDPPDARAGRRRGSSTAARTALGVLYPENVTADEDVIRIAAGTARAAHLQRTDPDGCWVAEVDGQIVGAPAHGRTLRHVGSAPSTRRAVLPARVIWPQTRRRSTPPRAMFLAHQQIALPSCASGKETSITDLAHSDAPDVVVPLLSVRKPTVGSVEALSPVVAGEHP